MRRWNFFRGWRGQVLFERIWCPGEALAAVTWCVDDDGSDFLIFVLS